MLFRSGEAARRGAAFARRSDLWSGLAEGEDLARRLASLSAEVEALEARALARRPEARRAHGSVRAALQNLRELGRWLSERPMGDLAGRTRAQALTLVGLELRWCYAAAGTRREDFERATQRSGPR